MNSTPPRRHYKNAPIVEAVIDIQLDRIADTEPMSALTALADDLKAEFPTRLPIHQLQMGFQANIADKTSQVSTDHQRLGWRLNAEVKPRVLQIRISGFTYSHFAPYSDWKTFSDEAKSLWKKYVDIYQPTRVKRRAVRVINSLRIPATDLGSGSALNEYLNFFPSLPESLPTHAKALAMQLQIPMDHVDPNAIVILGLYNQPNAPERVTLDIDMIVERASEINDDVFAVLDNLGAAKDDVFEACITDKLRELIQ